MLNFGQFGAFLQLSAKQHLGSEISDSVGMIAQPYHLYIERTDATKNMARGGVALIESRVRSSL